MIGKGQGRAFRRGAVRDLRCKTGPSGRECGVAEGDKKSRGLRSRIEELYNDRI